MPPICPKLKNCLLAAFLVLFLCALAGCADEPSLSDYMREAVAAEASFTPIEGEVAPFLFPDRTRYANTAIDSLTVYACAVAARDHHQYMSAFIIDQTSGEIRTALRFYAAKEDLAALPLHGEAGSGALLRLVSDTPVTVGDGETLAFGAADDPILWGYRAGDDSAARSLRGLLCGTDFATLREADVLCIDVAHTPVDAAAVPAAMPLAEADTAGHAALPSLARFMESDKKLEERDRKNAAMFYMDLGLFENTEVDHINVFATSVEFVDNRQFMTVYVIDTVTLEKKSAHRFYASADALGSLTPNRIVSLYCEEKVCVGDGETLAFGAVDDPLAWRCREAAGSAPPALRGFWCRTSYFRKEEDGVLGVDVYLKEPRASVGEEALRTRLAGKRFSILGDSISTHSGWSNSTAANSTIGKNAVWYTNTGRISSVDATWWKQAADRCGMEILVNNSSAGTSVSNSRARYGEESFGYNTRCLNLHDNTVKNNPAGSEIPPDIIAFFMGANDLSDGKKCGTAINDAFFARIERTGFVPDSFDEAYALTVYKMRQRYPSADLFCFQLPMMAHGNDVKSDARIRYNSVIAQIAAHYDCAAVDLFHTALSSYSAHTHDGLHPTDTGMDAITEAFLECLADYYGK